MMGTRTHAAISPPLSPPAPADKGVVVASGSTGVFETGVAATGTGVERGGGGGGGGVVGGGVVSWLTSAATSPSGAIVIEPTDMTDGGGLSAPTGLPKPKGSGAGTGVVVGAGVAKHDWG